MILSTCALQQHGGSLPGVQHPCGAAAMALDDGAVTQGSKGILAWAGS